MKLVKDDIAIHELLEFRDDKSMTDDKILEKTGDTREHRNILTRNLLFSRQRLPDDPSEVSLYLRYKLKYTERFDTVSLTKWLTNHSYDKKISYCSPRFYAIFGDTIDSCQIPYDTSLICRDNEPMTKT